MKSVAELGKAAISSSKYGYDAQDDTNEDDWDDTNEDDWDDTNEDNWDDL